MQKDLIPLEKAVQALGPSAKSFGRAFLQGHWGDVWLQSVIDLPIPPTPPLPVSLPLSSPAAILLEASR